MLTDELSAAVNIAVALLSMDEHHIHRIDCLQRGVIFSALSQLIQSLNKKGSRKLWSLFGAADYDVLPILSSAEIFLDVYVFLRLGCLFSEYP